MLVAFPKTAKDSGPQLYISFLPFGSFEADDDGDRFHDSWVEFNAMTPPITPQKPPKPYNSTLRSPKPKTRHLQGRAGAARRAVGLRLRRMAVSVQLPFPRRSGKWWRSALGFERGLLRDGLFSRVCRLDPEGVVRGPCQSAQVLETSALKSEQVERDLAARGVFEQRSVSHEM